MTEDYEGLPPISGRWSSNMENLFYFVMLIAFVFYVGILYYVLSVASK
jgi:hypothetical protein